jgi:stearoyl-CoA desaturase (Delta-9 desaturase)
VLWMFTGYLTDESRYAPDMRGDRVCQFFSRHYWAVSGLFISLCGLFCWVATGDAVQGALGSLYAGCLRITLIHHFTWAVNSIGHMFGTRVPHSKNRSTNNIFLAIVTLGDGLHSAHHQRPTRGVNPPNLLDPGGLLLMALEKVGWVWGLRRK